MTLLELQEILGERIEITLNENLKEEERVIENGKSEIVALLAKQMINNATVVLRAEALMAKGKITSKSKVLNMAGE